MYIERPGKKWRPLLGGGLAAVLLYGQYVHAKRAGLENGGTPTESYGPPAGVRASWAKG
jgi:hypothetical protein